MSLLKFSRLAIGLVALYLHTHRSPFGPSLSSYDPSPYPSRAGTRARGHWHAPLFARPAFDHLPPRAPGRSRERCRTVGTLCLSLTRQEASCRRRTVAHC